MVMMEVLSPKKVKDGREGRRGRGGLSNAVADWDVVVKTLKTDHKCSWMTRSRLLC